MTTKHQILKGLVIALALVHAILSAVVLSKRDTITPDMLRNFLIVSIVVCLIIAGLCTACLLSSNE